MTDRELMQMALDALGTASGFITQKWQEDAWKVQDLLSDRLAQPEPEPVAIGEEWKPCVKLPIVVHVREQRKGETHVSTREGITPVKEDDLIMRGVAGEEYPIGRELFNSTYTFDTAPVHAIDISQERVDETAKHEHEPVAWGNKKGEFKVHQEADEDFKSTALPFYITPPKPEWVGLTDEEVWECYSDRGSVFYRAVEAKLKEKNR